MLTYFCNFDQSISQSINQFISRHSTEARATVRLCRIKEKCLQHSASDDSIRFQNGGV